MSDPSTGGIPELPLAVEPLAPRPAAAQDLQARLHRRLGLDVPPGHTPMRKAAGLEYEIGGNAEGEAVLFIHSGTATQYAPLMSEPDLARRFRLIRYHRRGFAGSEPLDDRGVTIGRSAADALALLEALAVDRVHVVAMSGSGVIALQLALDAPSAVQSIVLEEPAIHAIDPRWNLLMLDAIRPMAERAREGDARGAMERWMRGISLSWRAELTRTVPGGPQQTIDDAEAFFADADAVVSWTFEHDRIAELAMPVLYVLSSSADGLTRAVMERFREVVPQTETAFIAESTHMLQTDQPQAVAAELAAFFTRHQHQTRGA